MKRHRQIDGQTLFGKAINRRNNSAGRKGYVARGNIYSAFRGKIFYKAYRVCVIVKRFPAAHKHHVCYAPLTAVGVQGIYRKHLTEYLARSEIAYKPAQRAGAELTAHTAADLRRYALRVAVLVFHKHALYDVAVGKREQIFFGSVGRGKRLYYF